MRSGFALFLMPIGRIWTWHDIYIPDRAIEVVRFHDWSHLHSPHLPGMRIVIGAESMKLLLRRSLVPHDRLMSVNPAFGASRTCHAIGVTLLSIQLMMLFSPASILELD